MQRETPNVCFQDIGVFSISKQLKEHAARPYRRIRERIFTIGRDVFLFDPWTIVRILFEKDPRLGERQHKLFAMPAAKQGQMHPPACPSQPSPAPSTARLDLNERSSI